MKELISVFILRSQPKCYSPILIDKLRRKHAKLEGKRGKFQKNISGKTGRILRKKQAISKKNMQNFKHKKPNSFEKTWQISKQNCQIEFGSSTKVQVVQSKIITKI